MINDERTKKMKKNTLLSWSSGKDSAWALHVLRKNSNIDLLGIFTVMNEKFGLRGNAGASECLAPGV
jgi:diphthamide synthase (EF-2-diphthine--ammonia ligase)